MRQSGHSLVELMVVVLVIGMLLAIAAPTWDAYRRESHVLGSARIFKGEFLKARSIALKKSAYTAIRFEKHGDGTTWYSCWLDGDFDGVLSADIRAGIDTRVCGPLQLSVPAQRVEVAILPGTRAIPPATGTLDAADPIKFAYDTISFSPLGTATPGTFYLAGQGFQAAVRVVAGSARVRLFLNRGVRWEER